MGRRPNGGPRTPSPGTTAVYRLFDASGQLLYVGVARDPVVRCYDHRRRKPWWSEVASEAVIWFPTRVEAEEAEDRAIKSEGPLHNILGTGLSCTVTVPGLKVRRSRAEVRRSMTIA